MIHLKPFQIVTRLAIQCLLVFGLLADLSAAETELTERLDSAFDSLRAGRTFRKDVKTATQSKLVNGFQAGLNGDDGTIEALRQLESAITEALAVRMSEDGGIALSEKGGRPAAALARTIIQESLEAELFGLLSLGSRDLINGTRLQFPGAGDANDPYKNLPPASHQEESLDERRAIYDGGARRDLRSLEYARLYFLEGIIRSLDVLRRDSEPNLRTVDSTSSYPPGWTRWNQHGDGSEADNADPSVTLPGFIDSEFDSADDQWSLTAGAQLGKVVRRFGGTVVTLGDSLWRKGHQQRDNATGEVGDTQLTADGYFQEGVDQLRCGMHAQYLAALPLAATLSDGGDGRQSEYQLANLSDVTSSVDSANELMRKIEEGVRPLVIDIIEGWDAATINEKAEDVGEALKAATEAWRIAKAKKDESLGRDQADVAEKRLRRSNFQYRLWQISGIHPDEIRDPEGGSDPLDTVGERENYYNAVVAKTRDLLATNDPSSPKFAERLSGSSFPDPLAELGQGDSRPNASNVSELSFAALRLAQQYQSLKDLQRSAASLNENIANLDRKTQRLHQIDNERHKDLNVLDYAELSAYVLVMAVNPLLTKQLLSPSKQLALAIRHREINKIASDGIRSAEHDAAKQNLLIEQQQLLSRIPQIEQGIREASLAVQRLLGETSQQLAEYAYYIDVLPGDLDEWLYDPEIRFAKESAEERYEQLVRALQQESYILARHLEETWLEAYEFPAVDSSGRFRQYTQDVEGASQFPDAESLFIGLDYERVEIFLAALKDWDEFLRGERFEGTGRLETKEISLRKQVFQLPDYRWDEDQGRYVHDDQLEAASIREFRALMVEAREQGLRSGDGVRFRLDFPIDIGLFHEVPGSGSEPVFSNFTSRREWNRRITDVGIKFEGRNVSQGTPTEAGRLDATLFLHGNTWRRSGKGLPEEYRTPADSEKTDLTLYQYDPSEPGEEGKQLFVQDINVLVGNRIGESDVVFNNDEFNATSRKVPEWPFNCDQWILTSRARANYDNITDVVLRIAYTWGHPPAFNLTF